MPAGQAIAGQEIKITVTQNGGHSQSGNTEQKAQVKLPSSWPPQTPEEEAAAADTLAALVQPSWLENRVVVGSLSLVAALVLYFVLSRINRQYKRQWLKKLRQVPGFSAVSDSSQQKDLVGLIDQYIQLPVFQCFFIAGAASVGFIWPHWDWMVLLVVILQHVLLRLLGFAIAAVCVVAHALAQGVWQLVASDYGLCFHVVRGFKWLSSWVKHGDVALLVTADSLDCSACPDLDDGLRLHSSDSTGSSCSSAGSAISNGNSSQSKQQQQQRGRKNKTNKSKSSRTLAQQQQQQQPPNPAAPAPAVNTSAAAIAAQPAAAATSNQKQRPAKAAAAVTAAAGKAASTQTSNTMLQVIQVQTAPESPSAADAARRVSSAGCNSSSSSRDQQVASASGCKSSGSGSKSRKEKAALATGEFCCVRSAYNCQCIEIAVV
jgi:hypothetical protein